MVEPPTEEEMNHAITRNVGSLMTLVCLMLMYRCAAVTDRYQMKAVKNFKRMADHSKTGPAMLSILGDEHEAHFVEPPMEMDSSEEFPAVGLDPDVHGGSGHGFRRGIKKVLARHPLLGLRTRDEPSGDLSGHSESTSFSSRPEHSPSSSRWHSGVYEERKDSWSIRSGRSAAKVEGSRPESASPHPALSRASSATTKRSMEGTRGHARDPLEEEFSYLFIGPSTYTGTSPQEPSEFNIGRDPAPLVSEPEPGDMDPAVAMAESEEPKLIVSESPGAAEFDIYETAYRKELERIQSSLTYPDIGPKVYLTRRVEGKDAVMKFVKDKALDLQSEQKKFFTPTHDGPSAFSAAVSMLRNQMDQKRESAEKTEQEQPDSQRASEQQHPTQERRESLPPPSSLSSQSIPGPEASSLEATGGLVSETHTGEGSTARLQRLLGRVNKSGTE